MRFPPGFDLIGDRVGASSVVFGAWLAGGQVAELVFVDCDGCLWRLLRGERDELVRFCRERGVRLHARLGDLCESLLAGDVVGLLPEFAERICLRWTPLGVCQ